MPSTNMAGRNSSSRPPPRGPASMRRGGTRTDRDGDLSMGIAVKGRGGISKSSAPARPNKDLTAKSSKPGILSASAQRQILRQAGTRDVSMKEVRASPARGGQVELRITGWTKSKASSGADGGVSSLIKWLEKKASTKLGSRGRSVKVQKVCRSQHADRLISCCQLATSGLPSFAANLRTTTAIEVKS